MALDTRRVAFGLGAIDVAAIQRRASSLKLAQSSLDAILQAVAAGDRLGMTTADYVAAVEYQAGVSSRPVPLPYSAPAPTQPGGGIGPGNVGYTNPTTGAVTTGMSYAVDQAAVKGAADQALAAGQITPGNYASFLQEATTGSVSTAEILAQISAAAVATQQRAAAAAAASQIGALALAQAQPVTTQTPSLVAPPPAPNAPPPSPASLAPGGAPPQTGLTLDLLSPPAQSALASLASAGDPAPSTPAGDPLAALYAGGGGGGATFSLPSPPPPTVAPSAPTDSSAPGPGLVLALVAAAAALYYATGGRGG